jgi:hypothetical protein
MIQSFFRGLAFLYLVDTFSYFLTKYITQKNDVHHNARWFFIHFIINTIATFCNYGDLIFCLKNIDGCTLENTSPQAYFATELVLITHIYHMLFFYKDLKRDEWIHHISMSLTGLVFYYQALKIQSVACFFCSGLPGMIDYFLLYLVKIKKLNPKYEKIVYLYLTTYIRSPGCILTAFLTIPYFQREQLKDDYSVLLVFISLIFWNGQYYMAKTCIDYGKKLR